MGVLVREGVLVGTGVLVGERVLVGGGVLVGISVLVGVAEDIVVGRAPSKTTSAGSVGPGLHAVNRKGTSRKMMIDLV